MEVYVTKRKNRNHFSELKQEEVALISSSQGNIQTKQDMAGKN
jgi:hypothetical protein